MTWFAFPQGTDTLQVFNLNGVAEKAMVATAAHGYSTMAEAVAQPNANPDSAQDIQIAADQQSAGSVKGGGAGGVLEAGTYDTSTKTFTKQGTTAASAANAVAKAAGISSWETAVEDAGDFLKGLVQPFLWIRVAKVTVGGLMVLVGLAKLTGFSSGVATTAMKYAPLL